MPLGHYLVKTLIALMLMSMIGCDSPPDVRLEELARESLNRQAQQNREIASQSRETSRAARDLVEADGLARKEALSLQKELIARDAASREQLMNLQRDAQTAMRQERAELDQQRAELHTRQQALAEQSHRDPIIAAAVYSTGLLLVCLLPLALAAYVVYTLSRGTEDERIVNEILIHDLVADEPRLLPVNPNVPAIGHRTTDRLPPSVACDESPDA